MRNICAIHIPNNTYFIVNILSLVYIGPINKTMTLNNVISYTENNQNKSETYDNFSSNYKNIYLRSGIRIV